MNKFAPSSVAHILATEAAEKRHPKPQELPSHSFPRWQRPAVMVGKMRGTAIAWTKSCGLIQFTGEEGEARMEWFEALLFLRLKK